MKPKIVQVTVITYQGLGIYTVNIDDVAEIRDESMVWEDHIDFIYGVYGDKGNPIRKIINCPVDVLYD